MGSSTHQQLLVDEFKPEYIAYGVGFALIRVRMFWKLLAGVASLPCGTVSRVSE
jgi:hypothetical protein